MQPEAAKSKSKRGGARPGAGRKPKLGTVLWRIRTQESVQAELSKRAEKLGVAPGEVVDQLVTGKLPAAGLGEDEKTYLNGLFMEELRRLEEPESARSQIADQRRRQAEMVREMRAKLTGRGE